MNFNPRKQQTLDKMTLQEWYLDVQLSNRALRVLSFDRKGF